MRCLWFWGDLISNIVLWLEKMFDMLSVVLKLLRLVYGPACICHGDCSMST